MKRKTFMALVALMTTTAVFAQFTDKSSSNNISTFSIGVRGGVDFASASSTMPLYNNKGVVGWHFGAVVDIPLVEGLNLEPGLYLRQKGNKFEFSEDYGDDERVSISLMSRPLYLEVPVQALYKINVSDNLQIQASAGPYLAYGIGGKMKSKISYTYDGDSEEESEEIDLFDNVLKKFDYGLNFGIGVTFSKHFHAGLSYSLGLRNIWNVKFSSETRELFNNYEDYYIGETVKKRVEGIKYASSG